MSPKLLLWAPVWGFLSLANGSVAQAESKKTGLGGGGEGRIPVSRELKDKQGH